MLCGAYLGIYPSRTYAAAVREWRGICQSILHMGLCEVNKDLLRIIIFGQGILVLCGLWIRWLGARVLAVVHTYPPYLNQVEGT